ncbi:MAG: PilN domain-containing protein [Fastidiosipilaceae bacterium]
MNNVSLLPPEIRAEQHFRRQLRIYILCSCLVILVFLCIYGGLIYLTNQEKLEVSRLQEQKAEITRKAAAYQKYGDLKAEVDALEKINADAAGVMPNWYYTLAEVGSHIPDSVWLTDYITNYNTEGDKAQTGNTAASQQGELVIRGKAFSHKDVAILLENLHDVKGLDNIRCQFSSEEMLEEQKVYEFEIEASLPVPKGGK